MSRRILVSGGSRPRELVLVGTLVVGRDPTCDIHDAADPLLSRRHAEISSAKDVTVRDLGSRNGILVNGVKKAQSVLRHGDVVQIGQLQVKFVDEVGPFLDIPGAASDAAKTFVPPAASMAATVVPATVVPGAEAVTVLLDSPTVPLERPAPRKGVPYADEPTPGKGVSYTEARTNDRTVRRGDDPDVTRKLGS